MQPRLVSFSSESSHYFSNRFSGMKQLRRKEKYALNVLYVQSLHLILINNVHQTLEPHKDGLSGFLCNQVFLFFFFLKYHQKMKISTFLSGRNLLLLAMIYWPLMLITIWTGC